MSVACFDVTGSVWGPEQFWMYESQAALEVERVLDVFAGRLAAYVVRSYLPDEACKSIAAQFWASNNLDARAGDGYGGVEAYLLGASHIEKTTEAYLDDVQRTAPALERVYAGAGDPIARFRQAVQADSRNRTRLRPARSGGREAGSSKLVYWNSDDEYLLKPHEDWAQTRAAEQRGFEIQTVKRVVAVNFYAEVPAESGQLQVWNVEPDDAARVRLGLQEVGYPYPPRVLAGFRSMVVAVKRGDLCVLNGNLVHAVLKGQPKHGAPRRVLSTCFMGQLPDSQIVHWT